MDLIMATPMQRQEDKQTRLTSLRRYGSKVLVGNPLSSNAGLPSSPTPDPMNCSTSSWRSGTFNGGAGNTMGRTVSGASSPTTAAPSGHTSARTNPQGEGDALDALLQMHEANI
eukprot:TRINITY_DN25648_c0_g1_i1.p3 TRINITY_DN25648_c0_g1~~TRINITY_DN25648_c0_g1_i1.p3  ORF type:complete len:114 (+),score=15.16 TRINITY_DN25648_c0_g1_i1:91-432(+)